MDKSYEQFDRPYRRGLVLGLSLAELFLILLFLLLLVAVVISSLLDDKDKELYEKQIQIIIIRGELDGATEKIATLTGYLKQANKNTYDTEGAQTKIGDLNAYIKGIEGEKEILVVKLGEATKEIEDLKEQLGGVIEVLDGEDLTFAGLINIIEKYKELKKGLHSPCWYTKNPTTKVESHVPIYDIKITNTGFVVRKHNISRSEDVIKGNELPPISWRRFNRELATENFLATFRPIFNAGKNKEIHDYDCRFLANVYDFTSETNKEGWQDNIAIVRRLFIPSPPIAKNNW